MIILKAGIMALVAVATIVGYSYSVTNLEQSVPSEPKGAGPLWDEHEHAIVLVKIHGQKLDFSAPIFQMRSDWIHFEGGDSSTIHRHAAGVTLEYLFDTLEMKLTDKCLGLSNGREFCTNNLYSLKFYINQNKTSDIRDYIVQHKDRILVSYGKEPPSQVQKQLEELESINFK